MPYPSDTDRLTVNAPKHDIAIEMIKSYIVPEDKKHRALKPSDIFIIKK